LKTIAVTRRPKPKRYALTDRYDNIVLTSSVPSHPNKTKIENESKATSIKLSYQFISFHSSAGDKS
jgi:hypothetical protein